MNMDTSDRLIRILAADGAVQITAIQGTELVEEARRIHNLSRVATAALGRQLMMTAMMAAELKSEGNRISTIIKGGGPGGNMVCTGSPALTVKGTILNPHVELPPTAKGKLDVGGLVGKDGSLTVVRDLSLKEPYVGSVDLVSGEIAEDFAAYYAQSEQQPCLIYLGVRVHPQSGKVRAAGGIFVRPMPGCPEEVIDALQALAGKTAELAERIDVGTPLYSIVEDVFSAMEPQILTEGKPYYRCDCSRERIEQALISVGREELNSMINEDHGAEVQCHFCNQYYRFSETDLRQLLWSASKEEHDEEELG